MGSKRVVMAAATVIGAAIVVILVVSFNQLLSPVTAKPSNPTISQYADISDYTVYKVGDGYYGQLILDKWQAEGLEQASIRSDILSEPFGGGSRVVVLFSDSDSIMTDTSFQIKIRELRNSGTKLVMVSENYEDHERFAELVGERAPQNVDFSGYKYFALGTMCSIDGQEVSCGGVPVVKTGTYRNEDGTLNANAMNEAILGFLAQAEID